MVKKIKQSSIKKTSGEIEVTIGETPLTKHEVMSAVAKTHSIYGATVWLNNPIEEYDDKTPAELMREGNMKAISLVVEAMLEEYKNKG